MPKERVRIALAGGRPDRVPLVLEYDYDYMAKVAGREPWEFVYADVEERVRIHEDFYRRHPADLWRCWSGPMRASLEQREIIREGGRVYCLHKPTGRRFGVDRRGGLLDDEGRHIVLARDGKVLERSEAPTWLASDGYPRVVETVDHIAELLGPTPPPEHWIENGRLSTLERLLPRYGGTHYLMFSMNTMFADALDLFGGFEEGLAALCTKRALFHRVMETIVEWKKSRLRAGASLGAPGAWMIEYCAGADTISPAAYREFVFPYEREVAREAHRLGLQVYIWFLGHLMPLLQDMAHLEVDGIFPEQGRKGYENDVVEMRRQLGERTCLIGFNDEQALIAGARVAL
ncbi:MAG: uroporphyrinogen decarboxylase family protein, partial [Anaerolineae bacterium]|nr:uroporphyrinogen decarboxylase family protein [Anaerolineae bacterium]